MDENKVYNVERNYISLEQKDELLHFLKSHYKLDFFDYSESSVRRRISKILNELRMDEVTPYIDFLKNEERGREIFLAKFTVNVTEMFRDPLFYKDLLKILGSIYHKHESIHIWSAGCSSGEEVLSLAILLEENGFLHKTKIIGTDLSASILQTARSRCYKAQHIKNYFGPYLEAGGKFSLDKYFERRDDEVCFDRNLYTNIEFKEHNLMKSPPAGSFDIIICRNVLIYFNSKLQDTILGKLKTALKKNGHLILGSKESIIFYRENYLFTEVEPETKIYKKRG